MNANVERLREELVTSDGLDEVIDWLLRVQELRAGGEAGVYEFAALEEDGLNALQPYFDTEPTRIPELLIRFVLPRCLDVSTDFEVRVVRDRRRDLLVRWIDEAPDDIRTRALRSVYAELRGALEGSSQEAACWTVAALGERDDSIITTLWGITLSASSSRNIALRTLCALGPVGDEHERLLRLTHDRAVDGYSYELLGAVRSLADARSVPIVAKHWLVQPDTEPFDRHSVFGLLGVLASANRDSAALQDEIWQHVVDAVKRIGEKATSTLLLGSNIGPRIDAPQVVVHLANWLIEDTKSSESWAHRHYLAILRMQECALPRQLLGWKYVDTERLSEVLRSVAVADTKNVGMGVTEEHRWKEAAWDLLLRASVSDGLSWVDEAVRNESNAFLKGELLETLSAFCLEPLPGIVRELIESQYSLVRHVSDSSWLAPVVGALEVAWSSAGQEAFNALVRCGFSVEGHGLQLASDALAAIAKDLIAAGDSSVVGELFRHVSMTAPLHQREAAAVALTALADHGPPLPFAPHAMFQVATEAGRDDFERGILISGMRPYWHQLPSSTRDEVVRWAETEGQETSTRALELLAYTGELRRDPHLVERLLGLYAGETGWRVGASSVGQTWAAYVTGILFEQDPLAFAPALADFLVQDNWLTAPQASNSIRYAVTQRGVQLPEVLLKAFETRVRAGRWERMADPEALTDLAEFAPERMVALIREHGWVQWIPAAREALASALALMQHLETAQEAVRMQVLLSLSGDSERQVRIAAYRALSKVYGFGLTAHAYSWCNSAVASDRLRAAEVLAWLSDATGSEIPELAARLAGDSDRRVRGALAEAQRIRSDLDVADHYLQRLVEVGTTNADILAVWPYASALESLAEGNHIDQLVAAIRERSVPLHVRNWSSRVVKRIKKGLKARERKAMKGAFVPSTASVHVGSGWVYSPGCEPEPARYHLWLQVAPTPNQQHAWGGTLSLIEEPSSWEPEHSEVTIELERGETGQALITFMRGSYLALSGNGPFPSKAVS